MPSFRSLAQYRPITEVGMAHVEALVVLFACITDVEAVRFDYLLGHLQYDTDGDLLAEPPVTLEDV